MDSKLRKTIATYLHPSTEPGVKDAARHHIERLAKDQGMTFDRAIDAYHANPEAKARPAWDDLQNDPAIKELLRKEQERKDREARMWAEKDQELQSAKAEAEVWRDRADDLAEEVVFWQGEVSYEAEIQGRMIVRSILLGDIEAGAGVAAIEAKVERLAASIQEIGLLNPISVVPVSRTAYRVVAGWHRLAAVKRLGWAEIPAHVLEIDDVRAEMATIDENLVRRVLGEADTAYMTARRKELYEALHPETRRHVAGAHASNAVQGNASDNLSPAFAEDTATATGVDRRTIERRAARGAALGEDLERIAGTSLDKGVELDALAKLPKEEREAIIEKAVAGEKISARTKRKAPPGPVRPQGKETETAEETNRRIILSAAIDMSELSKTLISIVDEDEIKSAPAMRELIDAHEAAIGAWKKLTASLKGKLAGLDEDRKRAKRKAKAEAARTAETRSLEELAASMNHHLAEAGRPVFVLELDRAAKLAEAEAIIATVGREGLAEAA